MRAKPPFEAVVANHGARVLRVCRAVVGPADADDAWSETFLAALRAYPDLPIPKIRYWVIFNNQIRTSPMAVRPRWSDIVTRSLELSTRSATVTAMRHLHAMAEISRLKRHADVEVRIVAIPGDWTAPVPGVFIKETMNNLADLGERMGADSTVWHSEPPPP